MNEHIKYIEHNSILYAICVRSQFRSEGIEFLTPSSFSQQLGYMNRPEGYQIPPHIHNPVSREVSLTKEVLFIKSGSVRADFYDDNLNYIQSLIIYAGDILLLANGGHGFEMLEPSEILEVKQGPYVGENDKTRFNAVDASLINIIQ